MNNIDHFIGSFDNFQQYWKENTEEEIHKSKSGDIHRHLHIKVSKKGERELKISIYEGRNNEKHLSEHYVFLDDPKTQIDSNRIATSEGELTLENDVLGVNGFGIDIDGMIESYQLMRCRYFSGWIEYPNPEDDTDVYRIGNLSLHDQGGAIQLDLEGIEYTVELTQLVFAHTIKIMKLAIYDLPMSQLEINSKAISYTWTTPEAKRLGINLRKIISGWTFIEEGMVNSDTMKEGEK